MEGKTDCEVDDRLKHLMFNTVDEWDGLLKEVNSLCSLGQDKISRDL